MNSRIQNVRNKMSELNLKAILVTKLENIRYLTQFTGTSGYVLLTQNQAYFLTDFRYMIQANEQIQNFEIIEHDPHMILTVQELIKKEGLESLGLESENISHNTYVEYAKYVSCIPTIGIIESVRMVKDEQEVKVMKEAAKIADQAFSYILEEIKPGVTEWELACKLENYMKSKGATRNSFETIVASGERSALPHGVASMKPLQENEFITFDFGAYYEGYCSDITRTVFLGQPTEQQREIYEIVLQAQLLTLKNLGPNMTGKAADDYARNYIKDHGYDGYFGHGTGHGLGMEVHEAPRLSPYTETVLQPGMIVTVEPGIYVPEVGGVRIEDDVLITSSGIELLTSSPKEFIILPCKN